MEELPRKVYRKFSPQGIANREELHDDTTVSLDCRELFLITDQIGMYDNISVQVLDNSKRRSLASGGKVFTRWSVLMIVYCSVVM